MTRATSCKSAPLASQRAAMLLIYRSRQWVAPAKSAGAAEATILLSQRAPHELQPCQRSGLNPFALRGGRLGGLPHQHPYPGDGLLAGGSSELVRRGHSRGRAGATGAARFGEPAHHRRVPTAGPAIRCWNVRRRASRWTCLHRIQIPKSSFHPKQLSPATTTAVSVNPYSTAP